MMMVLEVSLRRFLACCAVVLTVLCTSFVATAQDAPAEDYQDMSDDEQKGFLTNFVQDRLSTPERQIRLSNIDGVLGSDVSINEITIADEQGVWLRVNNAQLTWNQSALFFGRLEVESLSAESIQFLRTSVPAENAPAELPDPEASGFEIPEFPVAVIIENLSVPSVTFGEGVFGLGSEISVNGSLTLEDGNLTTNLDIERLDGPGGTLDVAVDYTGESQVFDVDVTLAEPQDGILANLLNIEGRPAVELSIVGSGPISDLRTELTFAADGRTALAGLASLTQVEQGLSISVDLNGALAPLIAEPYRPFFGNETNLDANALVRSDGGVTVTGLRLSGGQLSLEGELETTSDNFLRRLSLSALIASQSGDPVVLPVAGSQTRLQQAQLSVNFGGQGSENWTADITVDGYTMPDFMADQIRLSLNGVAANLDSPMERRITLNGDGVVSGITAQPEVEAALGDSIGLGVAALWEAGQPIQLAEFRIAGNALTAALSGEIANSVFDGQVSLETSSIAPFSGIAGRDLSGSLDLVADGTISPLAGGFNLTLDGTGQGLGIDDPVADRILEGTVALSGRVARTEAGLEADNFRLGNDQIQLVADGTYASDVADFRFDLDLADLSLLADNASGRLSVVGTAQGQDGTIALDLDASVPQGSLAGRDLRDATLGFNGTLADGGLTGAVNGDAFLDAYRVTLTSDVAVNETATRLENIRFETAGARFNGNLVRQPDGLLTGNLVLEASDVSTAAALAALDARGAINARVALSANGDQQGADISASVRDLRVNEIRVGSADVTAVVNDLFGVPAIDGEITGSNIAAAGVDVTSLNATATQSDGATSFDAQASLATGTNVDIAGSLSPQGEGYRLALDRANLTQGGLAARLANPTVLIVDGDTVQLDTVQFDIGSGSITATGSAGETLAIDLSVDNLPLSIANTISPELGLGGTINGSASITGSGSDPRASFTVSGSGIDAAAVSEFGISPLSFTANGSFADNVVSLASLSAQGNGGLEVSGSGTVPLSGSGLALNLSGSAPLALGNQFVADRGGQLAGVLNFNAQVSGSLSDPQFSGSASTSGASYVDPALNLRLTDIAANVALSGTQAQIQSISAQLATGGSVSGSGTIGLTGQFPANVSLALNSARYADGNLFVATTSGNLTLTGNLLGNPLLAGNVLIEEANITVPENFGGGPALIDVEHINTPADVERTLAKARVDEASGAPTPATRSTGLLLDVRVNAPNQIFVRGRGLDAEVGGSVRLTGPIDDIRPVGAFELIRGRLALLGQRITFETGRVTLVGDLDPDLNFVARTEGDGITVFITLSGRVSELDVEFSSNPELPQDEILARLIFNRSTTELSPLQLARLAGAVAELSGGGGGGIFDSLREGTGLDDLDVVTDDQGNVGVRAGTYIQDNVYLGVEAGSGGDSRVTINLDATENLTVRGGTGSDGESSVGVFYEQDY
ncbi:DUF490 domain-containing protein [Devosia pacifica]|uniref:DUF490 domain-containing protein n=1 Tax=Devosia pacifica TaxID=1335967 RepID=A0A918S0L9_9HYPH|nr:translocation/assembly module TamB domain-containing protein [Devosia pacifica]GHA18033.1 DUF490 domain-containing protein [Devosia pacifica]